MGEAGGDDLQEKKTHVSIGVRNTRTRLESKHIGSKQFVSTLSSFRVSTFITTQFFHQLSTQTQFLFYSIKSHFYDLHNISLSAHTGSFKFFKSFMNFINLNYFQYFFNFSFQI